MPEDAADCISEWLSSGRPHQFLYKERWPSARAPPSLAEPAFDMPVSILRVGPNITNNSYCISVIKSIN